MTYLDDCELSLTLRSVGAGGVNFTRSVRWSGCQFDALTHSLFAFFRYLTGSYMHEESPEGGRFKKEVVVDGQSFLLLIRDEGADKTMKISL